SRRRRRRFGGVALCHPAQPAVLQQHRQRAKAPAQRRQRRDPGDRQRDRRQSESGRGPVDLPRRHQDFHAAIVSQRAGDPAQAIPARKSKDAIDWCSSNNSTVCAIQSISVPVLFMAMGGHYYVGDGERYLETARSADKDFVVIEGATHNFTPCTRCEQTPGQYSNTMKNLFDYTAKWINARF